MVSPVLLTASGAFVCYKKWFDATINTQILKATTDFMLPLYVLFSLPRAYSASEVWQLWPLIVSPVLLLPLLGLMGYLFVLLVNVPAHQRYSVSSVFCFASIGNMSILVVRSCCSTYGSLHREEACDRALPYICMMWLPFNIVMFLMACPLFKKESGFTGEKLSTVIFRNFLLPLPIAAVIANLLGAIPGINWFLYDKDSVGYMFTDCAMIVGYTGILFSQMVVGSNMTLDLKDKVQMSRGKIIWIATTRNIFTPAVVLLYVYIMWNAGLLYDDRVMAFAVFIGLSSPSSFMILMLMKDFGMDTKEVTLIILWVFITSIVTMTLSVFFFFLVI